MVSEAPEKEFVQEQEQTSPTKKIAIVDVSPEGERTFTSWLKFVGANPFGAFEEVHGSAAPIREHVSLPAEETAAVETEESEASFLSDDELIEKFIKEEPKILPSKTEFYSPVNQAKKSVMDHDDTVSETLARIYLSQGNVQKARWCYQ